MLGIPIEDRARLEVWIPALVRRFEPAQRVGETQVEEEAQAAMQMRDYLRGLIATRRHRPGDDLISALVVSTSQDDAGQMNEQELLASVGMLLGAGFETTVNLIANSMLTLLRNPDLLAREESIYIQSIYRKMLIRKLVQNLACNSRSTTKLYCFSEYLQDTIIGLSQYYVLD
jgi:cytochrome P450